MDRILAEFADVTPVATTAPDVAAWRARDSFPEGVSASVRTPLGEDDRSARRDSGLSPLAGGPRAVLDPSGNDRLVLIKRFPADYGKARVTQSLGLRHPLIVPTRRWMIDSGYLYVVRDFISGINLRDGLRERSARRFDYLRNYLDPVLDALEYAHMAGQAHGAVSPENVLIPPAGVKTVLTDFGMTAHRNGTRGRYKPPAAFERNGTPTARADYFALCEVYKEFLPERAADDEAGTAARTRLLRNLSDVQMTSVTADELRYKLDAVTRIAELLGFCSNNPEPDKTPRLGPKLVCQVTPPTAMLPAGSGMTIVLTLWNEGDEPLRIEAIGSDVVWLNYHTRFTPFVMAPDEEIDLSFTLSAARLQPGTVNASLIIRSNHGMATLAPPAGTPWNQRVVALPVIVAGAPAPPPLKLPIAERLPMATTAPPRDVQNPPPGPPAGVQTPEPGIACTQEPDPALVVYGQNGVLHIGVRNIGQQLLRIDRVTTNPTWLSYPSDFERVTIDPGGMQYLAFAVGANSLTPGDYVAQVQLVTSTPSDSGKPSVWRDLTCTVRVRVVRPPSSAGVPEPAPSAGCATLIVSVFCVAAGSAAGLIFAIIR